MMVVVKAELYWVQRRTEYIRMNPKTQLSKNSNVNPTVHVKSLA